MVALLFLFICRFASGHRILSYPGRKQEEPEELLAIVAGNVLLSLAFSNACMSTDIVLKTSHLLSELRFPAYYSFFWDNLSASDNSSQDTPSWRALFNYKASAVEMFVLCFFSISASIPKGLSYVFLDIFRHNTSQIRPSDWSHISYLLVEKESLGNILPHTFLFAGAGPSSEDK